MEIYRTLITDKEFLDGIEALVEPAGIASLVEIERFSETEGNRLDIREVYQGLAWLQANPDVVKVSIQFMTAALLVFSSRKEKEIKITVRSERGDDSHITIDDETSLKQLQDTIKTSLLKISDV